MVCASVGLPITNFVFFCRGSYILEFRIRKMARGACFHRHLVRFKRCWRSELRYCRKLGQSRKFCSVRFRCSLQFSMRRFELGRYVFVGLFDPSHKLSLEVDEQMWFGGCLGVCDRRHWWLFGFRLFSFNDYRYSKSGLCLWIVYNRPCTTISTVRSFSRLLLWFLILVLSLFSFLRC